MSFTTLLHAAVFYGSLALFGAWAFAFNVLSCACAWLPAGPRTERVWQRLIRGQVGLYFRWLNGAGAVQVEYRGGERLADTPLVLVANHPGLLDAFYLLARVPRAVCVFKPAIRRNPALGAAARRAGYLASDSGAELLRGGAERIRNGASIVVFPEGTRTRAGAAPGKFLPGFAAIARRAGVPVQLVRITPGSALFTKEQPWWRLPRLPARVVVEAGPRIEAEAEAAATTAALVKEVEAWFGVEEETAPRARVGLTREIGPTLTVS